MVHHNITLSGSGSASLLMKRWLKEFLVYITELRAQTQFSFTLNKDTIHNISICLEPTERLLLFVIHKTRTWSLYFKQGTKECSRKIDMEAYMGTPPLPRVYHREHNHTGTLPEDYSLLSLSCIRSPVSPHL